MPDLYSVTIDPVAEDVDGISDILIDITGSQERTMVLLQSGGVVVQTFDRSRAESILDRLEAQGADVALTTNTRKRPTIRGTVSTGTGDVVYGAVVELLTASDESDSSKRQMITNRDGRFEFVSDHSEVSVNDGETAEISLRVTDADEMELSREDGIPIPSVGVRDFEIAIDAGLVEQADLPPQPGEAPLVSDDLFETITLATKRAALPEHADAYRQAVDSYICSLPPIHDNPGLVDIAEGVLRGRPEDIRKFRAALDQLEAWNHRTSQGERTQLSKQEAETILDEDVLGTLAQQGRDEQTTTREPIMNQRPVVVLITAAMRVGGDNPVAINRNLGILFEQFCGLERVGPLYQAAQDALSGSGADQRFLLDMIGSYTGLCEPGGVPQPPDSGVPRPIPCPGGPPWPPDPDDPAGDYPPDGYPGFRTDCSAPEIMEAMKEFLERRTTYSIEDISPPRACPGDTITITGSDFVFEGHRGIVLFSGLRRGTKVPATPDSWTDTEIEVEVPEGAMCGPLELDVPAGSVEWCGIHRDLHIAAGSPTQFEGGETLITQFSFADAVPDGCLDPGDDVEMQWETCNADQIDLTIESSGGGVEHTETFDEDAGRYTYTVPSFGENKMLVARLEITGPCGTDVRSLRFAVSKERDDPPGVADVFDLSDFENWHGNITRESVGTTVPDTPEDLVEAIRSAEAHDERLGVMGSRFSFTDCVVPRRTTDLLIDTSNLNQLIDMDPGMLSGDAAAYATDFDSYFSEKAFKVTSRALRPDIDTILSPSNETEYEAVLPGEGAPPTRPEDLVAISDRLVHVEAGIKLHDLNCLLDSVDPPLALPTMGGGMAQSVAGAFSTSTHGSTLKLPPPVDFVRAIHLVGPGGQQWWLEPESDPITDPDRMSALKQREDSALDPCLKVVYDDDLFEATLVSFGNAGIIYAVVIETVNAHRLESETRGEEWSRVKTILRDSVIEPDTPDHWFVEVTLNPTRECRLTTKDLSEEPIDTPEDDTLRNALLGFLFGSGVAGADPGTVVGVGTGAIATLLNAVPDYVARRTVEISTIPMTPWRWDDIREIREEIEVVQDLAETIREVSDIILSGADDEEIADALPTLLNLLWEIGLYIVEGREVVEGVQNIYTTHGMRPARTGVGKSFRALTEAWTKSCPRESLLDPEEKSTITEPDPYDRLMQSHEYAIPARQCIAFVDAILDRADEVRLDGDAIILVINLRFTQSTRALMGMQQFDLTCHVELFTPRGLDGNDALHDHVRDLAASFDAIPHWGQFHSTTRDFSALYETDMRQWKAAMNRIATESGGDPNTFRHEFALERGLLSEL